MKRHRKKYVYTLIQFVMKPNHLRFTICSSIDSISTMNGYSIDPSGRNDTPAFMGDWPEMALELTVNQLAKATVGSIPISPKNILLCDDRSEKHKNYIIDEKMYQKITIFIPDLEEQNLVWCIYIKVL